MDPTQNRKAVKNSIAQRTANSFEVIGREWLSKFRNRWTDGYYIKLSRAFEKNIFPWIGSKSIADITGQDVLSTLRRIEERGALETAHRMLTSCSQVFQYAIASERLKFNPAPSLRAALIFIKII